VLYLYSEEIMLAIRLPQSVEKRLEKLARRTGRTKSFYAREAIVQHLEISKHLSRRARARAHSHGEDDTIPLDDVMKRHGMEN